MSFENFMNDHFAHDSQPSDLHQRSAVVCLAAPGSPVLFVSKAFQAHTGYRPEEAVGRGLSFLQGPDTEPCAVEKFRHLITTGTPGKVQITNYRKDGTRFVHECELRPVRDASDAVTHFIAIQRPV